MRFAFSVLFLLPFLMFSQEINLDSLSNRYVDLSQYINKTVKLTGDYEGDRIVFSNATNVALIFDGSITTTHSEDAIAFLGNARNIIIGGKLRVNGSITFWARMDSVEIYGIRSIKAHTGIRATQDYAHTRVNIHNNLFSNTQYEGIYIGPSKLSEVKSSNVRIHHNRFIRTGWDAAQVGNCISCDIESNLFLQIAYKKELYQDWTVTVNPGSLVRLRGNIYLRCPNRLQCLDSRCFEW